MPPAAVVHAEMPGLEKIVVGAHPCSAKCGARRNDGVRRTRSILAFFCSTALVLRRHERKEPLMFRKTWGW